MDTQYWAWKLTTDKGEFQVGVSGRWDQFEASKQLRKLFDMLEMTIVAMVPRKRITGPADNTGTICQIDDPATPGFQFYSGKKFFDACGRTGEYEAERILLEKEMS
jgi:hypothetical protein